MEAKKPVDDLNTSLALPSENPEFVDEPKSVEVDDGFSPGVVNVPGDAPDSSRRFKDRDVPDYTVEQIGDLLRDHRNYFVGIAGHTLGRYGISWNPGLAEDIVQIAFAELHKTLTTIGEDGKRRPFNPADRGLFRFAITLTSRRAHDYSERAAKSNERTVITDMQDPTVIEAVLPQSPSAEERWLRKEDLLPQYVDSYVGEIRTIFETLTPRERQAFLEYYQTLVELDAEDLTEQGKQRTRAAKGKGRSTTSRVFMSRARHKLADAIETHYGRDIIRDPTFVGAFALFLESATHENEAEP